MTFTFTSPQKLAVSLTCAAALLLSTACTTMNTPKAEPTVRAGKITTKQTIHDTILKDNPIDATIGFGSGSGHFGWGINMGVNEMLGLGKVRENITYNRYTVEVNPNESIMVQDNKSFAIGDCVEVLDLPGDTSYPKIRLATTCSAPQTGTTP